MEEANIATRLMEGVVEEFASGAAMVVMVTLLDSSPILPSVVRGTTQTSYVVAGDRPVRVYRGSELLYYVYFIT